MKTHPSWLNLTNLDEISHLEMNTAIERSKKKEAEPAPRTYPGYPVHLLPLKKNRWFGFIDSVFDERRSHRSLGLDLPDPDTLSRLLRKSHGIVDAKSRGPTPSAGGLQSLELYIVVWEKSWLPSGVFHYNRPSHHLSEIVQGADRTHWGQLVPSMDEIRGGAFLWVLVGESAKITERYGQRGERLLLLEAGHLMQNLCLMSKSLGLSTVPFGKYLESKIFKTMKLPTNDRILYTGICGKPFKSGN